MTKVRLVNRYSVGNGTKKEIDEFNKFYDLEEARLNHEERICIEANIEDCMVEMFG